MIAAAALTACSSAPLALTPPGRGPEHNTVSTPTREVIIGVDQLSGGFNPHTLADLTPVSTAVAGLALAGDGDPPAGF